MGTIRLLTTDDYDAICQVIDSRPYFQGRVVNWHDQFKELYVKNRLPLTGQVYFLGYFDDSGELIAFRESHKLPIPFNFAMGVSYTKNGKATERYPGTQWPNALMELNHAMLDLIYENAGQVIWVVGPATPPKAGRLVEAPGTRFTDLVKYKREEDILVKAGTLTGDPILDKFVLWGYAAPTDQVVMRFTMLDHKFKPPPDAPAPGIAPTSFAHPPMNLLAGSGDFTTPPPP